MKRKDKNKTLIGIIFRSNYSKAVYYWKRGKERAEVIISAPERPKGLKVPFSEKMLGIETKSNKIIFSDMPDWEMLKEIHK